ncbi:bacteriohemerythrin [Leadbettera azotonutricia]|uniref:Hemerythrin-like domain-containing protein n=1 Tax=Leadbettera azotonutricia (strain ATCC BAA-888 / DSM 13862 / ZAS-9) TaxID=545695 RepID=F5YEF9_LEAAZ|nr:bacteriohemerythrin [Leadbettera azotonutricia]AEF83310.1 conserved hypothetical protein [Leadbettera azotonutricia ZAS-9]
MEPKEYTAWDPKYLLNIKKLDNEHKEIINFINDALKHCNGNREEEIKYFNTRIQIILKYIAKHFSAEEEMMEKTNFPHYEEHKAEHGKIFISVVKIMTEIEMGKREIDLLGFMQYIRKWCLEHILTHDKGGVEYFKKWEEQNGK